MSAASLQLKLSATASAVTGASEWALAAPDALLLAWLALEGPTSRERLAGLLWPASTAEAARNALRQRLFRLRKQLGVDVVAGSSTLQLAAGVTHDLQDAVTLLAGLQAADSSELDSWLARRRGAWQAQTRSALEQRIETLETAGDTAAALPLALQLLQAEPLSEDAHRRVMRLHYLRGDRAAAMLAFDHCEHTLKHEVGARPSAQTLALLSTIESSATLPGAPPLRTALPASVLRPPRLIGRDAELSALQRGLAAGHVVVLIGEAGMGKSRLLQSLAAANRGLLHASGRPGDHLVPYATLARALRQLLDHEPSAADPGLRRALAPLLPELGGAEAPPARQPPLAQPVLALLRNASHAVSALALDDLHFADDATLELLQLLLASPRDATSPVPRWCLGLRPPTPGSRLHDLLDALATAGPHTRLTLQPLGEAQMAELVDSLALPGVSGAATAALLHQRSGGNPLFALETLKLAWNEGTITLADGLPRPSSLGQLIGQQLSRLSAPALQLARVAAVAGVDFGIPLAQNLLQRNPLELADAWAELEAQHVLRGPAFAHDLIHDAVLQGLPEVIARHLHGSCAAWLEANQAEPARVAAHWEAAGQRARALPALRAAAERAHRALREEERIALLLRAAEIAEAAEHLDEAFDLVDNAIGGHMSTIRQADGLPLLSLQARLARSPLQQARAAGNRAWYAAVLGDLPTALTCGEQALKMALPLGDPALVASLHQRLGTALVMAARFNEALPHMHAAEAWMETRASVAERCEFLGNLAVVLDNLGRPTEARPHHLRAIADSAIEGDLASRATLLANHALSRLDAGDLATAAEQAAQAQRIVVEYELAGSSAGFIATLSAQCARAQGHYSAALQGCDRAEALLAERNPARVPVARLHRAHIWLDLGQHARAQQLLDGAALETAHRLPARYAVRWLVLLARVKRRLGARQAGDVARLLDEAAALAPADGWPELGLIVATEQALALAPPDARAALERVARQAHQRQLHGAELGALLHASLIANQTAEAEPASARRAALAALALAPQAEALHADRALRWWAPAQALAWAGRSAAERARGVAWAEAGQEWLRTTAAAHVAPEFVDSFLHQHPLNRALLTWRPSRPEPPTVTEP